MNAGSRTIVAILGAALGVCHRASAQRCPADCNQNGSVQINELVTAVNASLSGCDSVICGEQFPLCGNGLAEPGEACDGSDLRAETCATLGYSAGAGSPAQRHARWIPTPARQPRCRRVSATTMMEPLPICCRG